MAGVDYWDEEAVYCGRSIPVAQLLIDGWARGEDDVIAALDRYVYESGDRFIGETLLHLRRVYKKPMYRGAPSSSANLPGASNMDDAALKLFRSKSPSIQKTILKKAVDRLQGECDIQGNALFANKQDWIGVYLLVTARLKVRLPQKDFPAYPKGTISIDTTELWTDGKWCQDDDCWKVLYWAKPIQMLVPPELMNRPRAGSL